MNDDPATLCKFLDERCRAELDRLSASLTQLSSEADTIRRYRTWVEGFSIADNSDVNGAMAIWGKAAETVQRLNAIDRELRRYYQFDSPKGRHSRTAAFLLNTNSLQALYLVLEAEELVRVCRAFATAAARQRGIIGAGAELTDDAYRELAITVQSSGLSSTLPNVAPPPAPPPPAPPPPAPPPPAGARTSEGGKRRNRITRAEAEIRVRDYLAKHAVGNPDDVTRDAVAKGTGVSTGMVSNTTAWQAFSSKRDSLKTPHVREVPFTERMQAVIPADTDYSDELAALIAEQADDLAEDERRHNRRHKPS